MKLLVELEIEKEGKKIKQEANSFLIQFFELLRRHFDMKAIPVKMVDGTESNYGSSATTFKIDAGENDNSFGIVVGTGSSSVDICNDYALENKIDLNCSAVTIEPTSCESGILEIKIWREFTNNTGSDVEIKEVGLYCAGWWTSYIHCIDRTVLVEPLILADGQTAKFTYKIKYVA